MTSSATRWYLSWVATGMALLAIVLAGAIVAMQSNDHNNVQDARIFVLQNNITYLDMVERIAAENITNLSLRVNTLLTQIDILLLDINVTQTDILALNTTINLLQIEVTDIYSNITYIQSILVTQQQNLTALLNATHLLSVDIFLANQTLYDILYTQLRTINSVVGVLHNIDLVGACSLFVYPSFTNASTIVIDTCALEAQIIALTSALNSTLVELFQEIIMSNTTIGRINFQYPAFGNINLTAIGAGITIGQNVYQTNGINVNNTGVYTLNGNVTGDGAADIQLVPGLNFTVTAAPAGGGVVLNATADHIGLVSVVGGAGISAVTNGTTVTVGNRFTAGVLGTGSSKYTCYSNFGPVPPSFPITPGVAPLSDVNFGTGILSAPCRYGNTSSTMNLNDVNATYLIYMHWEMGIDYGQTSNCNSNYREEFYYCIGAVNCAILNTPANVIVRAAIKRPVSWLLVISGGCTPPTCGTVVYSHVATFQSGSTIPVGGNRVSMGWRITDIYANTCTTMSTVANSVKGEIIVQRIG